MKRPKILFILNHFENLSITNNAFKIGSYLEKHGFIPYFLFLSSRGIIKQKFLAAFGSRVIVSKPSFLQNIITVADLVKKNEFSFVVTQTLRADYAVFLAKATPGNRFRTFHVANRRNYFFLSCEPRFWIKNILYFISCHLADVNLCCAHHLADKLIHRLRVETKKVQVIPNGVKIPPTANKPNEGIQVITYTGQLVKRKNLICLLKALEKLKADFVCQIIGSGPEKPKLIQFISEHNLNRRIKIIPDQLDVRPFLKQTDIFVLPSLAEGMSLSLLEAMSYGIACVGGDIDANREIIDDGQDGILFSLKKGPADLAKKLEILITDSRLRRQLGEKAREKIIANFNEHKMLDSFVKFYQVRVSTSK